MSERTNAVSATLVLLVSLGLPGSTASAQLRPLEPIPWRILDRGTVLTAEAGASTLTDQRASLAGTAGTLAEVGTFAIAWRTGRVGLEVAGTGWRLFEERSSFASPYPDVAPSAGGHRRDVGDLRLSTIVRFTNDDAPVVGVVRFGTRLPTTDNTTGLDRDVTDFFATVGGLGRRGAFTVAAELGLGIHGTREPRFEQDDLFLYSATLERRLGAWTPSVRALGQLHGYKHPPIRSVEDLGEVRVGLRYGDARWIRVEAVHGYATFSPSAGVLVSAGLARGR